ncbi:lanthionine synthetase C family protein [Streptomyces wuyuanensis]|uniref:lanthionine synthetase C family protein n=1 Tax=Streptomyces wuyuanensis TaxID=1196353 RepID=UPI00341C7663
MTAPTATQTVVNSATADRALKVVDRIAEQLADPAHAQNVVRAELGTRSNSDHLAVMPPDLGHGQLGAAMLYGELARNDSTKRALAHGHIAHAAKALATSPDHGLISGPAALLAVAQTCANGGNDYADLRHVLAQRLATRHKKRLSTDPRHRHAHPGTGRRNYDWIGGLAGTTRILLDSADDPHENDPEVTSTLEASLRHLTELATPIVVDGHNVPGWWVPADQAGDPLRARYPDGLFDLGMAHGITGPLTALCSALNHGREVEGQRNAIEHITRWLLDWLLHDDAGPYWPALVSLSQQTARQRDTSAYTRNAWCYGSPGVAAAVHHAGVTLRRPDWCRTAITVLNAALARDQDQWELEGPTLCHGYAGFLQILTRTALASDDPSLRRGCRRLTDILLSYADSQADFTFRRLITTTTAGTPIEGPPLALNAPGMLEGAAGIACALLATTRARDDHTQGNHPWDRFLGLA